MGPGLAKKKQTLLWNPYKKDNGPLGTLNPKPLNPKPYTRGPVLDPSLYGHPKADQESAGVPYTRILWAQWEVHKGYAVKGLGFRDKGYAMLIWLNLLK